MSRTYLHHVIVMGMVGQISLSSGRRTAIGMASTVQTIRAFMFSSVSRATSHRLVISTETDMTTRRCFVHRTVHGIGSEASTVNMPEYSSARTGTGRSSGTMTETAGQMFVSSEAASGTGETALTVRCPPRLSASTRTCLFRPTTTATDAMTLRCSAHRRGTGIPLQQQWPIFSGIHWGQNGDIPVPGDYDGDGRDDIAIYRDGTWYIVGSAGSPLTYVFGLTGDLPIPKMYIR